MKQLRGYMGVNTEANPGVFFGVNKDVKKLILLS